MDYLGMLNWTSDIPAESRDTFIEYFQQAMTNAVVKMPRIPQILEIGSYAGTSIREMSRLAPTARCVAIDNWGLSQEECDLCTSYNDNKPVTGPLIRATFLKNTKDKHQIELIEMDSSLALDMLLKKPARFDFIYVDGSHRTLDVLLDITLAWQLLRVGGILALDDVLWTNGSNDVPRPAIEHFMHKFEGRFRLLSLGYRAFLGKIE